MRKVWMILVSSIRLRCPRCMSGPIFLGPFRMKPKCPGCDLVFEREPGYWIGSIYLNYGLTVVLMVSCYFTLETYAGLGPAWRLVICGAIGVVVPLLFFRHARVLWMAIDRFFDPSDGDQPGSRHRGAA